MTVYLYVVQDHLGLGAHGFAAGRADVLLKYRPARNTCNLHLDTYSLKTAYYHLNRNA